MSKIYKTALMLVLPMLLAACSTSVDCDVVAYHTLGAPQGEKVRIVHQDSAKTGTPEFNYFAEQIQTRLEQSGYTRASSNGSDLIFAITYDFGEGPNKTLPLPKCHTQYRFLYEDYGSPYYRGLQCIDDTVEIQSSYTHFLQVKIYRPIVPGDPGEVIYEGMVHSVSRSDSLERMMPYLIAALFDDFPGESGEVRSVIVDREKKAK